MEEMTSSSSSEGSSIPEPELELGLGLSCTTRASFKETKQPHSRILTAQDSPSLILLLPSASATSTTTMSSCSSTSSSCSTLSPVDGSSGSKRAADSIVPSSQIVGWPPVRRAYRMNGMVNQSKSVATQGYNSRFLKAKSENPAEDKTAKGSKVNNANCNTRTSFFVKVYMDRMPIGRKIDLSTQGCYETLAQTLEEMFLRSDPSDGKRLSSQYDNMMRNSTSRLKLLDRSSEFVLTYEDKDGDWMLVGDVPWGMFISSVRKLKIMRASEATGVGKRVKSTTWYIIS